jgi:asparagine synthase (glutamine-hydrolysing)
MCGIAGFSGDFDPAVASRAGAALRHRGPDDAAEWYSRDGRVGLAHRRLSIIDVSPAGRQPMSSDAGHVVSFNGEIYNYRELRSELKQAGHAFRTQSDTEVLLQLYAARGEAMLPLLNGIFAFAMFDRSDGSLLLACDAFGIKPLYFAEGPTGVVFASELKALVASGAIEASLDLTVLFRILGFLWSPGGATPLKGVGRLGPGEALRVKDGRVTRRWRWLPQPWADRAPLTGTADAADAVRDALRTAVHRQLVSDVPVGAFLSGGLDSTSVVAMAREAAPGIQCFTIDTGGEADPGVAADLPYARQAAGHLGVTLHEVRVDAPRMAARLEEMVARLDEPLADPAPLNVLFISELARQTGIKVLLSGAGGDDLFSGYRRHQALVAERYWASLPTPVRRGLRMATSRVGKRQAVGRRLSRMFAAADAAPDARLTSYFLWTDPSRITGLFRADVAAVLDERSLTAPFQDYLASLPTDLSPLDRMLALEQRFFLTDHNLLYTDKMGMSAGVEIRVPFLDTDLVRLANSLPWDMKQRGRQSKWVLKKAMEPLLPRAILHRPKTGFGAPVRRWLRHEWRDLVGDTLSPASLANRGVFDPAAVGRLMADDRAGRVDGAYTILALVCIEIWCRRFLQSPTAAPVRSLSVAL